MYGNPYQLFSFLLRMYLILWVQLCNCDSFSSKFKKIAYIIITSCFYSSRSDISDKHTLYISFFKFSLFFVWLYSNFKIRRKCLRIQSGKLPNFIHSLLLGTWMNCGLSRVPVGAEVNICTDILWTSIDSTIEHTDWRLGDF